MSDLELLFLVLVCLYGWECACWLRPGSVAFVTWLGGMAPRSRFKSRSRRRGPKTRREAVRASGNWRAAFAGSILGNRHGGFILAPPLPPLGHVLTANEFPLSFSTEGVLVGAASTIQPSFRVQAGTRYVAFSAIQKVQSKGRKLLVNGELFLKAASPALADSLAVRIRELVKTPVSQRALAIEKIFREILDAKGIRNRCRDFAEQIWLMRWLANALFLYIFIGVPVMLWNSGLKYWIALLAGLLAFTTNLAFLFRQAHKKFYPEAEDDRFTHFLIILMSPVTSIRALDTLSRPLLESYHPLAVAAVFCSAQQFRELAARALRNLSFPLSSPSKEPVVHAAERESRSAFRKSLEILLKQNDVHPEELLRPPEPADGSCQSYCPRCLAQFTRIEGTCPDCGAAELRTF